MGTFNENLRHLREKSNFNQRYMANKLNISQPAYVNYEKGSAEPSFATLCTLATIFNVSTDELLGFREIEERPNLINLESLDATKSELISNIVKSSDSIVGRLDAFYQGIKVAEQEREAIVNRIKGQKKDD